MPSRPLTIALASGILLVAVVSADASMNQTYYLEAQVDGNWVVVAIHPYEEMFAYRSPSYSRVAFDFNASDELPMRVRFDNGHLWSDAIDVQVRLGGNLVFEGRVQAAARDSGVATFTVQGERVLDVVHNPGPRPEAPGGTYWELWFEVAVDGREHFGGPLSLREVSR